MAKEVARVRHSGPVPGARPARGRASAATCRTTALANYLKHCSLGRLGDLDEVARFAAFLVSDAQQLHDGETVLIDGGV